MRKLIQRLLGRSELDGDPLERLVYVGAECPHHVKKAIDQAVGASRQLADDLELAESALKYIRDHAWASHATDPSKWVNEFVEVSRLYFAGKATRAAAAASRVGGRPPSPPRAPECPPEQKNPDRHDPRTPRSPECETGRPGIGP